MEIGMFMLVYVVAASTEATNLHDFQYTWSKSKLMKHTSPNLCEGIKPLNLNFWILSVQTVSYRVAIDKHIISFEFAPRYMHRLHF